MSDEELTAFYESEYRQLYQGDQKPSAKDLAVQRLRAETLSDFINLSGVRHAHHLDIGCSAGLLLQRFRDDFGCQPTGIEPGNAYRSYAQRQGLDVVASLEELTSLTTTRFGLISMIHVLEHIADPVPYLTYLRQKLMTPGGWLLVEVPNLYAHDCFEVAHLVSYSDHTLQRIIEKAGFAIQIFREHGRPRSNRIPLYLTLLARPVSPAPDPAQQATYRIVPEQGVKIKRQLGLLHRHLLERLLPRQAWLPLPTSFTDDVQ
jgi:2-polyprenyl-3-methyl-5-hydroxy-6-metoxy-1,4-benzoquinol methylase